ncbi:hypothetical protein Ahy_A10g047813 [Arachis hypogaea]|uniref:Aminotransferase-like plant mobile domain-containing protein n=1 Tax=Arachis hypogaea TaxID=3818 RepID=A0A445B3J4_ARAHY|nr:hypothetical protein Ahy_A10g047813 [Arachis hypogaea]
MACSSSHATTQDKGKGHAVAPPSPPALHILNQVNDEVIDDLHLQINNTRILIHFTIGADTHCFLGPIESLERANKKFSFFPSAEGEDLLINQAFNNSHFINQKSFRNNLKINPRGFDFTARYQRLEPTKSAAWGALGIQELLRLSHFSLTTYLWMIGAVTCFWNRTTNNFHLSCGMIGMSLLDVAAITGLPINPLDCTLDMQPKHHYNDILTNSYSDSLPITWVQKLVLPSSSEGSDESEPTNKDVHTASSQSEDTADSDPDSQLIRQPKPALPFTAAHSITSLVIPYQPILQQHHDQGNSSSHDSIQATGSTQSLDAIFPPSHVTSMVDLTKDPPQHSPTQALILESTSPNNQAAPFAENQVAPDSDSPSRNVETSNSDSSRSRVLETPRKLPSPPNRVDFQTPLGPRPETSSASTTPASATLANLISVLNQVIQENKVPVPVPTLSRPATSRPSFKLNTNTREQLRSLIKLLDHPLTTWVNDIILNQLLADLLNSSFELPANTPNSASIQGFKQLLNESIASQFQLQKTETKETNISKLI